MVGDPGIALVTTINAKRTGEIRFYNNPIATG